MEIDAPRLQLLRGVVERAFEVGDQFVDFTFRDDDGRRQCDAVADDPQDQRVLFEVALDDRRDAEGGIEHPPRLLVSDDVEAGNGSDVADIAEEPVIREPRQRVLHVRADPPRMTDEVHLLIDALNFERDDGGDRVRPICITIYV
jgi:hypothetical protein